jgi:hypothetical protein
MTQEESLYLQAGRQLKDAQESQMFGKPCFKINGKAFISFFNQCMVFKLSGTTHAEALSLDGSEQFDPSGKGRPMKEWVQVPAAYQDKWSGFAEAAFNYVKAGS